MTEIPAVIAGPAATASTVTTWACATGTFAPADCPPRSARAFASETGGAPASAPGAPGGLSSSVTGSTVLLSWTAPAGGGASSYVVEAGSAGGLVDLANFDTGSAAVTLTVTAVPPGSYFVRVRAKNSAGSGTASNEVLVAVAGGACTTPPGAPAGLVASANGTSVTLSWAAGGGCAATGYVIEAGSAAGLANLANFNTGTAATSFSASGVGAGKYFVRVRAANAAGSSAASNEVSFSTGSLTPTPTPTPTPAPTPTPTPTPVPAVFTITATGVSPKNLVISQGTQVTFVNQDVLAHDMTSDPHPEHSECPEINQVGFLVQNQSRQTGNLNIVRTCGFHDHANALNAAMRGSITIR